MRIATTITSALYLLTPLTLAAPISQINTRSGERLYIGNLAHQISASTLKELFGRFGHVVHVSSISSHGSAFVTMGTAADAEDAVRDLDGRVIDGKRIRVELTSS
ncbi:hypothetical protein G7Y89_g4435 [Cudoniella acicularis]|uniref:RRM domain-containing protein n=1 Tax=Cudoniella acicularis TaxID=354080 RepID=A0A8H4RPH2_9HELO|nr:hypothetical protein G7Y89_g4435 [Cudoniella acicularis]